MMKKFIAATLLLVSMVAVWVGWQLFFAPNVNAFSKPIVLRIPTGSSYVDVLRLLREKKALHSLFWFEKVATLKKYPVHVRPGNYLLTTKMNNRQIVNLLRAGLQTPVKLVFYNVQTKEDFASCVGRSLEIDSALVLQRLLSDTFCHRLKSDTNNVLANFVTDNYELYWNSSFETLLQKLLSAHNSFWSDKGRMAKAEAIGLTRTEVVTLASIVEKECIFDAELPRVAGVYLNRLRVKMPLQADPTLKYALRDFDAKRVVNAHKEFDTPFNTYLYPGLPPGPICMPRKKSIDAVLNAEQHSYFYFCANPDLSGYSIFSKTYEEQMKVARMYQRKLNKIGVY